MIAAGLSLAMLAQNVATTPAHRLGEAWWKERHERCVEMTKRGGIDLLFLGDSITQGWEGGGKAMWDQHFAPLKAGNFGFSGDRTEHVLWRLENGEMVGLHPKVIVIMIGTNNIGHGSSDAAMTASGVREIVLKLQQAMPKAKILLLDILPRGGDSSDRMRQAVADASRQFRALHDGKRVFCEDSGSYFLNRDGSMRRTLMPDLLHPNSGGYEIWAKALVPMIKKLI